VTPICIPVGAALHRLAAIFNRLAETERRAASLTESVGTRERLLARAHAFEQARQVAADSAAAVGVHGATKRRRR